MKILGISGLYHDSAAAICVDGEIIAAAQEERFTRIKHDKRFPKNAIAFCLKKAKMLPEFLDMVVYYDNPFLTLERWTENLLQVRADHVENYVQSSVSSVFGEKLWINKMVESELGCFAQGGRLYVTKHHIAHAASAFYPSPFESAAVLTIDGVGEWATTAISHGSGSSLDMVAQINYPHSIGLLYAAFTYFCGFKVNSGEYKLMGLAPYGKPLYAEKIKDYLIDLRPDGSYALNMDYFDYFDGGLMTNEMFSDLFDGPARQPESSITRREMDLAASIQQVTEEAVIALARQAKAVTGERNLCLAGGVALNCVANSAIQKEGIFDRIWVQPAAGDAGGALGAALYAEYTIGNRKRCCKTADMQKGSYLGQEFSKQEILVELDALGARYIIYEDRNALYEKAAKLMADGKILGFFQGRAEFGPRALGNRSILADPRNPEMQSKLNLMTKFRESFRPFAPAVLWEKASDWFEIDESSPYMLFVADVCKDRRKTFHIPEENQNGDIIELVNFPKSDIPAVTHMDYSARLQTVHKETNPNFYALIHAFDQLTGCPVVINTSFNVRGEPIVNSPTDAYQCFMRAGIDALILENVLLLKEEQSPWEEQEDWRNKYELD